MNAVLKDWGCVSIFFVNYNRYNRVDMGLCNPFVEEHMDALFGKQRANELRPRLESLSVDDRELAIVEAISDALGASNGRYVLPFRFRNEHDNRTSHLG